MLGVPMRHPSWLLQKCSLVLIERGSREIALCCEERRHGREGVAAEQIGSMVCPTLGHPPGEWRCCTTGPIGPTKGPIRQLSALGASGPGLSTTKNKMASVVYLLESMADHSTYLGVTGDLPRRLRQHNGRIWGGAKHTSRRRPWRLFAHVKGFAGRREALQFESRAKRMRPPYRRHESLIRRRLGILEGLLRASPHLELVVDGALHAPGTHGGACTPAIALPAAPLTATAPDGQEGI